MPHAGQLVFRFLLPWLCRAGRWRVSALGRLLGLALFWGLISPPAHAIFLMTDAKQDVGWKPQNQMLVLINTGAYSRAFASWNANASVVRMLRPSETTWSNSVPDGPGLAQSMRPVVGTWSVTPDGIADPTESLIVMENMLREHLSKQSIRMQFHAGEPFHDARIEILRKAWNIPILLLSLRSFEYVTLGGVNTGWHGNMNWDVQFYIHNTDGTRRVIWQASARSVRLDPRVCAKDHYQSCMETFVGALVNRMTTEGLIGLTSPSLVEGVILTP